jgi:hypothetical protein
MDDFLCAENPTGVFGGVARDWWNLVGWSEKKLWRAITC